MKGTPDAAGAKAACLAFLITFAILIANGRAIGSGDTHAMERTAAALAQRGSIVLDDEAGQEPFTRPFGAGRVSIYPVLPALLSAPFFFVFGLFFDLGPSGQQVAGKLVAAGASALSTGLLARSFSGRASWRSALLCSLVIGVGTSVFSTSQALWQHPFVVLFLVAALGSLARVDEAAPSGAQGPALSAALWLSLAAAARPAAIPMCALLFSFLLHRARDRALRVFFVACLPAASVAIYNWVVFGAPWRFGPSLEGRFMGEFPASLAGLLISPGRGLIVFTPIALIALWGLIATARQSTFARVLLAAAGIHLLFVAAWNEWHGGESFGPRLLTDLLPALFFFLPGSMSAWPRIAPPLAALSVAVQLLGGWTYDYRWERLHQRGGDFGAALWSARDSPIPFALREGVFIQGIPQVEGRRIRLRMERSRAFGPQGSLIEATPVGLRVSGPNLLRDIRLERGARLSEGWIALAHPQDALAFRIEVPGSFQFRIVGASHEGKGTLRIETSSGLSSVYEVEGDFDQTVRLALTPNDEVFIRTGPGGLRLARVEASELNP